MLPKCLIFFSVDVWRVLLQLFGECESPVRTSESKRIFKHRNYLVYCHSYYLLSTLNKIYSEKKMPKTVSKLGKLILKESRKQDLMQTLWTPKTTFKNSSFQLEESRWLGEKSFNLSSQLVSKLDFFLMSNSSIWNCFVQ